MVQSIIKIISSWEVIIIGMAITTLFPVIFYLASINKKAAKKTKPKRKASIIRYASSPIPTTTPSSKSSIDIEMKNEF